MASVIVRIASEDWATELDIRDYLECCLSGDEDIYRIWHVYPNERGSILSAEASILDQLQQFQGFKQLWPSPEDVPTELEIRDCLHAAAVAIANPRNPEISQCFSSMLLHYGLQNDLGEFLRHDREQRINFLHMSIAHLEDIYELLCPLLDVDGVHPEFLSTIQLADKRVSGIMERYRKWESENPRLFQEMVGFTSRVSALRGYMLEWSDRFGLPFTNPNGLRAVVHEGIGELSTLLQEQKEVLEKATDSEKAFYKSLALNEEIPEKVELFYGCTSFGDCGELFLDPKKWKHHEYIHFQKELWRCDSCSKFIFSSITFKTHLKDEHRMLEATIAEKLASNHIGKNYQGSFWCSFCHKIETHHLQGRDAHNKRLDHMERHFEERKDDLKDIYPEKRWTVGGRDGCQIINPTSGRINNLLALAKKQDEELRRLASLSH